MPIEPSRWMRAGMMPILALPGEMTPGQFGPISLESEFLILAQTFTMSSVGMPSVMQTIRGKPAASATVLKTGQLSCVVPPLPGVTPPTTTVPYSAAPLAWNVPSLPVIPCTINRVFLSTKTAILCPRLCRRCDDKVRGFFHRCAHLKIQPGFLQNLPAFFDIGSFKPQHDWHFDIQ